MSGAFLIYGSTGFVGAAITRLAIHSGLQPVLAGRSEAKLKRQAAELGVECRVARLNAPGEIDRAFKDIRVVLNCAGPYLHTAKPIVAACLRNRVHYLDLTGELPVFEAIAARDAEAKARGIMLLPGAGFDVAATDCLAVHLKERLPSATSLTLAFKTEGPFGLPPGTQRTIIELLPYGNRTRRNGRLEFPGFALKRRWIDFGQGYKRATRLTWGDVITAYHSTNIPNIENYAVLPEIMFQLMVLAELLRPIFKLPFIRALLKLGVRPGPAIDKLDRTFTHVWGEVENDQGQRVVARLHGPEAGVIWTARAALAAVQKVLDGHAPIGFQTPGLAYGADFVLECEAVTREDVV
jgi:short subunit dehydrogenase-like uncharacterized protein